MHKIGLKLWSINVDNYQNEIIRLYEEGVFDFIELYVVPETLNLIDKWLKLNIPFAVHAPHAHHGLNFSDKNKRSFNKNLIQQTELYANELGAIYTVFHPGIGGDIYETIQQLQSVKNFPFLIENKPYVVPTADFRENRFCIASTLEQIKLILDKVGCSFCFDIGHAIASANYQKKEIYEYLNKINLLKPRVYHISDITLGSIYDQHLHLGTGSLDLSKIKNIFLKDTCIVIETKKDSTNNLDDFKSDCEYVKKHL